MYIFVLLTGHHTVAAEQLTSEKHFSYMQGFIIQYFIKFNSIIIELLLLRV